MPRGLKMNSNDISRLSYKELQALALRYRVPGNIKKKLLVKVLQAAKGGNENEVGRLLQDLKQNRKKRVRKIKAGKLGITSTPLHSPNYVMADDYYCPQQQPPYQWIGAEEEIPSRDDETRIPHYEEFKQFLLRRIQREFQTYDTNNNQVQESAIVDLRTVATSSSVQGIPVDSNSYSRPNIITVNNADSYVCHTNDHVEYQTLEDPNGNTQGSILLKKMLQAPVGANLGEIASPVFGGYRLWSMEQYQSNNLLDNSDTLTAESENDENECNLDNNAECYGLLNSIKGEYFLNEPTFVRNVEDIGQQISNVLTNDNSAQYRYSAATADIRQSYENWAVSNVIEAPDNSCATGDGQGSKIVQTMYYNNSGSESLNKTHNENLPCQYRMTENGHSYNSNQELLNLNPSEESQYYDTNMISSIQSDSPNAYYLQNLIKYNGEASGQYFHNLHSLQNMNVEQDPYASTGSHTFPNDNQYNPNIPGEYSYSHANQENSVPLSDNLEQQQQSNEMMTRHESSIHKDSLHNTDRVQATNGVLDPFWPKWFTKNQSGTILENILNLYSSKRVDLARLDQTSCVYSYIAPIVTHTPASPSSICSQKEKYVAEYRQHSFSPHWLLYNDTSCGMRMANLQSKLGDGGTEDGQITNSNGTSDARESGEIEDSICETWSHDYANYEPTIEKDANMCEGLNVEATDCLFSVITTEPLDTQVDNTSASEAQ